MAKIILSIGDTVRQEIVLSKERTTIGRRAHNDIVLDHVAISAEHAVIVTILGDSYLEDLNSTNGTQINGQPVKKHYLQDNDVVELAHYRVRYLADKGNPDQRAGAITGQAGGAEVQPGMRGTAAAIRVLNGASTGKEIALTKVLTTIGRPGVQVAVLTRGAQGYSITHVEGARYTLVNGQSIGSGAYAMKHGDVIDLSGTLMMFMSA